MIRHSPAEYYIKYLVVGGYEDREIEKICDVHGLIWLGEWHCAEIRGTYKPPTPFLPEDKTHVPTQLFITKEMIRQAFYPEEPMRKALKLLEKPRPRELVETMILSGAPHSAIVHALKVRHEFVCSTQALDLYRHYFWDIDLLDSTSMRAVLKIKHERALQHPDPKVRIQHAALQANFHNDPRVIASKLPASPLAGMLAQISVGVLPKNLNIVEILENVRTVAALRGFEAALQGGPTGAEMGQGYMSMSATASSMLETVVKPEDQLRTDLMNIGLKTVQAKIPILNKLTSGNHTVDLSPEPKSQDTSVIHAEELDNELEP